MFVCQELLDLFECFDICDLEYLLVVLLVVYFEGNDFEECIVLNQWGYGCLLIVELYVCFVVIVEKFEVEGVYVGLYQDWGSVLDDDSEWFVVENVYVLISVDVEIVEGWLQGLECDGVGEGWLYG